VRGLISFVIVAITVVFQLTVVDRIAFPGGSGPDLVLVVVAALALASGPLAGAVTGFWGGLALDVAPPGSHFTGQDALVFCLIGYACGLLADDSSGDSATEPGHTALFEIVVTAAGAICGEALVALLGVMLSDPRVTWPAITHVLPVAVAYDVLLCPFVLYAAAAAWRLASTGRAGTGREPRVRFGGSASRTSTFSRAHLGRSLLGGSVFSRAPAAGLASRGSTFTRSAPLGRSSPLRHRNQFKHLSQFSDEGHFRSRNPFRNQGRGQLKSPGRGWLRGSARRRPLARGLSSAAGRHPLGPARLHMPRPKGRRRWRPRRWRTGGYR
jgi:rod shape-determining protein MreD